MAIAYDAVSNATGNEVSSLTWSHTCSGSDRVLVVGISIANTSNSITGVTYNGVAMTKASAGTASIAPDQITEIYYLANPATEANNIVASFDSTANSFPSGIGVSLTGCDTDNSEDTSGLQAATTASPTVNLTTNNANSFIVDKVYSNHTTVNVGAGQTERATHLINNRRGAGSTEPTTTAGAYTMSWSLGGADRSSIVAIAINEKAAVDYLEELSEQINFSETSLKTHDATRELNESMSYSESSIKRFPPKTFWRLKL